MNAYRFANLRTRLLTAGVLIGVVLGVEALALWSCVGRILFLGLLGMAVLFCAGEFASICWAVPGNASRTGARTWGLRVAYGVVVALPALYVLVSLVSFSVCAGGVTASTLLLMTAAGSLVSWILAILLMVCGGRNSLESAQKMSGELFIGVFLIGMCGGLLQGLPLVTDGAVNSVGVYFIWLLIVVCCNDAAAYFVGSRFGGPLLAPKLSPRKTVSGSLGGLVFGVLLGVGSAPLLSLGIPWQKSVILCVLLVLSAQLGDLAKSFLKRVCDVKDSGVLLPGHGGIIDRIDGVLAATPVLCLFLLSRSVT